MKRQLKAIVLGAAIASTTFCASAVAAQKIAVVNFVQVFKQAPQGQVKVNTLKSEAQPQVEVLKSEQQALAGDLKTLQKNAPTLSKADRQKQEQALGQKQVAFQQKVSQLRGAEMKKEQAAAALFEKNLKVAISTVAKAQGYDLVINKQAAPYSSSDLDITNAVVAGMKKIANS